jgi:hypothetical protein
MSYLSDGPAGQKPTESEIGPSRRRALIRGAALLGWFAAVPVAVSAEERKKRSKESVGYRDFPYEGRTCSRCLLYAGNGVCVIVEGEVSENGWCTQWAPLTMGERGSPVGPYEAA